MNIKVILQEDVSKLGDKGDVVEVTRGYARNFLFKKDLAKKVSEGELKQIQSQKEAGVKKIEKQSQNLDKMKKALDGKRISAKKRASSKGKLYAAVTSKEISREIKHTYGFTLPEESIKADHVKEVGLHPFKINIAGKGDITMKIKVKAEKDK